MWLDGPAAIARLIVPQMTMRQRSLLLPCAILALVLGVTTVRVTARQQPPCSTRHSHRRHHRGLANGGAPRDGRVQRRYRAWCASGERPRAWRERLWSDEQRARRDRLGDCQPCAVWHSRRQLIARNVDYSSVPTRSDVFVGAPAGTVGDHRRRVGRQPREDGGRSRRARVDHITGQLAVCDFVDPDGN